MNVFRILTRSSKCCVLNFVDEDDGDESPALVERSSSPFEDRPHSRILQFLRTLLLFFVLLGGFKEWFYISAGSLPYIRRVISCILFSLEQSRVDDLTVAEHHPDSILEPNVLSFELSQLLSRRMNDFPRQFCQIKSCTAQSIQCVSTNLCTCSRCAIVSFDPLLCSISSAL